MRYLITLYSLSIEKGKTNYYTVVVVEKVIGNEKQLVAWDRETVEGDDNRATQLLIGSIYGT